MEKTIGLFSGQGSQYIGMGKSLFDNFKSARDIYSCGSDILGIDLAKLCFEGDEQELNRTLNSQPAIFAHSVAAYNVVSNEFLSPLNAVAGHSLGEFAALYAAGAYSLEDGFRIIGARAKAMETASETAKGSMVAVLGVDYSIIETACKEVGGFVFPVNLNLETQTVISGEQDAVEKVSEKLIAENKRAKVIKLSVNSAFHTTMMSTAASEFKESIQNIKFSPLSVPFFSNVTGTLFEPENYPEYFALHMVSPVNFTGESKSIEAFGITKAIEFGPKKTVSTFFKKNCKEIKVTNVDTMEDLENLKEF